MVHDSTFTIATAFSIAVLVGLIGGMLILSNNANQSLYVAPNPNTVKLNEKSADDLTTNYSIPEAARFPSTNRCDGINCYTCSSVNGSNPHCEDPINTHMSNYTEKCMVPKKGHVGVFPANFCIKIVGKNTDTYERIVVRACVMKTMDSQCGMFRYQDQAMTGCVLTCDYNGCNKAERSEFQFNSYTFAFIAVVFSLEYSIC